MVAIGRLMCKVLKMDGLAVVTRLQQARETRRRFRRVDLGRKRSRHRMGKSAVFSTLPFSMKAVWYGFGMRCYFLILVWPLGWMLVLISSGGILEEFRGMGEEIFPRSLARGLLLNLKTIGAQWSISYLAVSGFKTGCEDLMVSYLESGGQYRT